MRRISASALLACAVAVPLSGCLAARTASAGQQIGIAASARALAEQIEISGSLGPAVSYGNCAVQHEKLGDRRFCATYVVRFGVTKDPRGATWARLDEWLTLHGWRNMSEALYRRSDFDGGLQLRLEAVEAMQLALTQARDPEMLQAIEDLAPDEHLIAVLIHFQTHTDVMHTRMCGSSC